MDDVMTSHLAVVAESHLHIEHRATDDGHDAMVAHSTQPSYQVSTLNDNHPGVKYNPNLLDGAIFVLYASGADACCGFVCCENEAVKCNQPPYLPEELNGIVSFDEYNQLCDELNQVFSQTVFPLCPCMLVHFCLPFSHICVIFYYESKRREGVRQVLDSFNKRVLSERGAYYFESIEHQNFYRFIAKLRLQSSSGCSSDPGAVIRTEPAHGPAIELFIQTRWDMSAE